MKAIINTAPNTLELKEVPTPQPGPGQVRVKVAACGICATDLAMIAGWSRTGFPSIPGHEWSGVVDAVGPGAPADLAGSPCVAENVLGDGGEVGFEHPGGYGQYLLTEAKNVLRLPAGLPFSEAAMIEPLAVSVRVMNRLRVQDISGALVLGDGPIGLLILKLLRRAGVSPVFLAGGRPERLALAREFGADGTVNYHELGGSLATGIASATGCREFANIIEASGSSAAMAAAVELASGKGKILIVGDYGQARADFPWNTILHRELELIGSNASAGGWPEAVAVASDPAFGLSRFITKKIPAEKFAQGMAMMNDRRAGTVKIIMEWI